MGTAPERRSTRLRLRFLRNNPVVRHDQPMAAKAIHAYLSDEAHEGWQELAAHTGCSVTALIEVIGQQWMDLLDEGAIDRALDPQQADRARSIDAARRRRK